MLPGTAVDDGDRLFECTKALVEMFMGTEELRPFLLPTYLPDMMAALLQLAYGPSSAIDTAANATPVVPVSSGSSKATPSSILSGPFMKTKYQETEGNKRPTTPRQKWASAILQSRFVSGCASRFCLPIHFRAPDLIRCCPSGFPLKC